MEAAALAKVALTSWKALVWFGDAKGTARTASTPWSNTTKVLILGGSGGTGSAGIQLANIFGAGEILTTTSGDNIKYCKDLGANIVFDYHTTNWWEVIPDDSLDVVYDTVGEKETGNRALKKLHSGGHYVTITGSLPTTKKAGVSADMFINSDTNLNNFEILDELADYMLKGSLRMHSLTVYPLEAVEDAFKTSAEGHVVGKLGILVTNSSQERSEYKYLDPGSTL